MQTLSYINFILSIVYVAVTSYTFVYMLVKLFKKPRKYAELAKYRYAVVICARNEEDVIAHLIESISKQKYPQELVDVFVVADNCTDNTANVARMAGARVFERFNENLIGKGYALSYFFDEISELYGVRYFDGFFVIDADNLLDENYIAEMNKVFSNGYKAVTSYRNTKNYGDSWISACYGIWFLRESEYMNFSRGELGVSAAVSGTGFLFSSEILEKNGGWNYHLLTEDLEFTADLITKGEKIGYCHDGIVYDEQPSKMKESIIQRSRWAKGGMQVMSRYASSLIRETFKKGSLSCYDMLMGTIPMVILTIFTVVLNGAMFIIGVSTAPGEMPTYFLSIISMIAVAYIMFFVLGLMTVITEWKRIHCSRHKKILYTFMFPFFMLSFLLSVVHAVFASAQWKPIKHNSVISISDIKKTKKKGKKKPIF